MRQYLLDLYEIQKIDLNIREQERAHEALPARLRQLESNVADLQGRINSLTEQRNNAQKEGKALHASVDAEKDKIRKWEARLNEIRNQREYQALQRETEGSKRANRDNEEKIGELKQLGERLDKELHELEAKLSDEDAACTKEKAEVETRATELKAQIEADRARRNALVPRIPKPVFRKYDSIRSKRFGIGLSPVAAGCCTGCNMKLPPQLYNILQRGDSIEQCPSCHRLIFWDQILPTPGDEAATGDGAGAHT